MTLLKKFPTAPLGEQSALTLFADAEIIRCPEKKGATVPSSGKRES